MQQRHKLFIKAYQSYYGGTKRHATEVYKMATKEYIDAVIELFEKQSITAFFAD